MSKRLFVGGLPYEMTEEKLQELFSACGRVEKIKIMFDRATGRSKGFGFIEMATELEGNAAILKFDGSTIDTRRVSVKEAKPAENRVKESSYNTGRSPKDNRPRENRFLSDSRNHHPANNGFAEPGHSRPRSFDKPALPGGFGGMVHRGGPGKPGQAGTNGLNQRGYGRSGGQGLSGGRSSGTSDWRSELGIGVNQRKDFRRSNRDHHRDHNRQHDGDNFGNR